MDRTDAIGWMVLFRASIRLSQAQTLSQCGWAAPRMARTGELALRAYLIFQREQMEKHKWLESQKAARDLADGSLADWVGRHSAAFCTYWKHTHVFVPAGKQTPKE